MLLKSTVTALVALTTLAGIAAPFTAAPDAAVVLGEPHAAAHAHNDYEHGSRATAFTRAGTATCSC